MHQPVNLHFCTSLFNLRFFFIDLLNVFFCAGDGQGNELKDFIAKKASALALDGQGQTDELNPRSCLGASFVKTE